MMEAKHTHMRLYYFRIIVSGYRRVCVYGYVCDKSVIYVVFG